MIELVSYFNVFILNTTEVVLNMVVFRPKYYSIFSKHDRIKEKYHFFGPQYKTEFEVNMVVFLDSFLYWAAFYRL